MGIRNILGLLTLNTSSSDVTVEGGTLTVEGTTSDIPLKVRSDDATCILSLNDNSTTSTSSVGVQANGDDISLRAGAAKVLIGKDGGEVTIGSATDGTFASNLLELDCGRAASSSFDFLEATSGVGGTPDIQFRLSGDGNGTCDGSWTGGGADYAELLEWADGNPSGEDRRGMSVVLSGDKIALAQAGDDPIGVISANPSVVGDGDIGRWKKKYQRDDFGSYIYEGGERKLNPDWNENQPYTPREDRAEWDAVGLVGKLRLRKGQPVGARWVKMRDVSATVEEWLVR